MYLVSPDHFRNTAQPAQPPTSVKKKTSRKPPLHHKRKKKRQVIEKQHPYDKWFMFRKKIEETNMKREALIKEISEFLGRVLRKNYHFNSYLSKMNFLNECADPSTIKRNCPRFSLNIFVFQWCCVWDS